MCLTGSGLVVGSYVPFWSVIGERQLCAFLLEVGGRQVSALQVGGWW
jgi:hypothetical protein